MQKNLRILLFVIISAFMASCTTKVIVKEVIKYKELSPPAEQAVLPQYEQKMDNFIVILDASGSMDDTYMGRRKLEYGREIVSRFNQAIPSLTLMGVFRRYGKGLSMSSIMKTERVYGPENYSRAGFENAVGTVRNASGLSFMESAVSAVETDLRSKGGRTAVIIVSDGKVHANKGFRVKDPVRAAERLNSIYGDCICIYTVFIPSDITDEGEAFADQGLMERVARAGECGFSVSADSLSSASDMENFVKEIFLSTTGLGTGKYNCPPRKEDMYATGKDIIAAPEKEVYIPIFEGPPEITVEFDFAKAKVMPAHHSQIRKIAEYMKSHPGIRVTIEGHTDSIGSQKYNLRLSKKRAENVRRYLIKNFGIEGSRLNVKWYGESRPVSDNKTEAGRQKNRRAVTITVTKE